MKSKQDSRTLRADVAAILRELYPNGVVTPDVLYEESYFDELYDTLRARLAGIEGVRLLHERSPEGGPQWVEGSNPDEDPPDYSEDSFSYHLFFVAPRGEGHKYVGELPDYVETEDGEELTEVRVPTEGWIGCAVGVSLAAPFAMVVLRDMEFMETGWHTEPDIECNIFNLDGTPMDMDAHYAEMLEETDAQTLLTLRDTIMEILRDCSINVLTDEEADAAVPGLRAGEEVFAGYSDDELTVKDALFFRCL